MTTRALIFDYDGLVVDSERVLLEDSPHGCEAALAAGMRVIACPSVVNAHCEFPPDVPRVSSLADVTLPSL